MTSRLTDFEWEGFHRLSVDEKSRLMMQSDNTPFHTLYAQQFDLRLLDRICALANVVRAIAKTRPGMAFLMETLCHKRAMLYFTQPSSRTFLSFCSACQILGLKTGEVRENATSSEFKGESREDSVRTFSSYFDMIVMRTPEKGLAERMAWALSRSERPVPIVNAGSGQDQHPTQALLDVYTLKRSFDNRGGLRNRCVVFVGDLARGRTVRSLSFLLSLYPGVTQVFVAPDELQVREDVTEILQRSGTPFRRCGDLRKTIPEADAVYMTRIQDEWDEVKGDSARIDVSNFKFGPKELELLSPNAIIMHPLPRRDEIAPEIDSDPRAMYWRQMRNGMWVRVAVIAMTFGAERRLHEYYRENF